MKAPGTAQALLPTRVAGGGAGSGLGPRERRRGRGHGRDPSSSDGESVPDRHTILEPLTNGAIMPIKRCNSSPVLLDEDAARKVLGTILQVGGAHNSPMDLEGYIRKCAKAGGQKSVTELTQNAGLYDDDMRVWERVQWLYKQIADGTLIAV